MKVNTTTKQHWTSEKRRETNFASWIQEQAVKTTHT